MTNRGHCWQPSASWLLGRLAALDRDLADIIQAAGQANADDEHDPEGATIAFERQHTAALLGQARDQLAQIDAAIERLARRQLRGVRALRPADRCRPACGQADGDHLHHLRRPRRALAGLFPAGTPPGGAAGWSCPTAVRSRAELPDRLFPAGTPPGWAAGRSCPTAVRSRAELPDGGT